ncbi:MAG: polyphosphate:AMP phosphotransferase [Synergistaceae bacterium]|jgi:polyphosphate:AMP phosphotransferase|nr:polyphosphate:AMP phosphotransferase [Synergistaceae bacterium]
MLEMTDLSRRLDVLEYRRIAPRLRERMGELQRRARRANMPVIIVFEGWEASGKGTLINELIRPLDPRGFRVHYVHSREEEPQSQFWPPMRRFWDMTPARGTIGIFSRSWHRLLFDDPKQAVASACRDLASFERQLSDDGYVIIKFFLHISKKEQRKRLKKMDKDDASTWRVSGREWRENDDYDERARRIDEIIQHTDGAHAPWTLIEAHDRRYAVIKILTTVVEGIEAGLENPGRGGAKQEIQFVGFNKTEYAGEVAKPSLEMSAAHDTDQGGRVNRDEYDWDTPRLQNRLRDLQYELYKIRRPMVIVFEGHDASGKGGCIKRLTQKLDPRGYQVVPIAAPNDWERAHHYLWRFWTAFPKAGHIGIYDRSWYGRVLVEKIEGFCEEFEWRRAYAEINEMEDQWRRYGTIIVKFWLQIDADEQLARFTERQRNPDKNWKITSEDWRNREKRPLYDAAAEEMMLRTSTVHAPWTIVEAKDKLFARTKVLRRVIAALESALNVKT